MPPNEDTVTLLGAAGKTVVLRDSITGGDPAAKAAIIASITGAGGIHYKGMNVATRALKDALEGQILSYEIKFYIQDDNANWVDFSDRAEVNGRNMLKKMGSITHTAERIRGQLQQRLSSVTVSNGDGFWDRPMPPTLNASLGVTMDTLAPPVAASFPLSSGGKESVFFRRKAAVRVHYMLTGDNVPNIVTLGVFLVEDFATNGQDKSAQFTFAPLSAPLLEAKASLVKRGDFWYKNAAPEFLVRKILESSYRDSTGGLPSTWDIDPVTTNFPIPIDGSEGWESSQLTRPGQRSIPNAGGIPVWTDEKRWPKAMCAWTYETGSIEITAGSAIMVATSAGTNQWDKSTSNLQNKIQVGDTFIIAKEYTTGDGGSSTGHDGNFTIISIADVNESGYSPSITLDRVPQGGTDEAAMKYSIVRMYSGVGTELYEYGITGDTYRQLTTSDTIIGTTGRDHIIRRLWVNTADTNYPIWGVGIKQPVSGSLTSRYSYRIFKFRWNGTTPDVQVVYTTSTGELGEYIYQDGDRRNASTPHSFVGQHKTEETNQTPIVIPFQQSIQELRGVGSDQKACWQPTFGTRFKYNTTAYPLTSGRGVRLEAGYYGASCNQGWLTIKYTIGQMGCLQLVPNAFNDGALFYAEMPNVPAQDATNAIDTANYWLRTYKIMNLDTGAVYTVTTTELSSYDEYVPTATCLDHNNDLIVSFCRFGINDENAHVRVVRFSDLDNTSGSTVIPTTDVIFDRTDDSTEHIPMVLEMFHYHDGSEGRLYMSCMYIDLFAKTEPDSNLTSNYSYRIFMIKDSDATIVSDATMTQKASSKHRMQGMGKFNVGTDASPDNDIFYYESVSGRIMSFDNSNDADTVVAPSEISISHSDTTPYQLTPHAVFIHNAKEFYWTSSMLPILLHMNDEQGDFRMAKWSPQYSAVVGLAQFSSMSAWDAIDALAEISNSRFGFNPDGTFFFVQKPRHQGSAYTFTNTGKSLIQSINKRRGQTEIVNHSVKTPSKIKKEDIKVSVRLTDKSGYGEDGVVHKLDAIQHDDIGKIITLVCTYGGPISADTSGDNLRESARFKYKVSSNPIVTSLGRAFSNGNLYIETEFIGDIKFGSPITMKGENDTDSIDAIGKVGIQAKYSGLNANLRDAVLVEDDFMVLKSGTATYPNIRSGTLDSLSESLAIGMVLLIGDLAAASPVHEYVRITGFATTYVTDDTILVSRAVHDNTSPKAHIAGVTVFIVANANKIYSTAALSTNGSNVFPIGSSVTIDTIWKDQWSSVYRADPTDGTSSLIDETHWYPVNGLFRPIGGSDGTYSTNVSLKLEAEASDLSDDDLQFRVGDSIRLEGPGIELVEDSGSPQVAENRSSITKWGKRESQKRRNILMDENHSKWTARREIRDQANPHYTFTLNTIMAPWIAMSDIITIQDRDNLPTSSQFSEKCYITQMTYDPQSRAMMQIVCRSIDAY